MLLPAVALVAADCATDNCIRALVATQTPGRLSSAQSFCTTFIAQPVASTDIPSFASHCSGDSLDAGAFSTRLSSACSCIGTRVAATTALPTPTSGLPITSTTLNQTTSASFTTLIKPSTTPPADSPTPTEPCEVVSRSWASAFRGRRFVCISPY